MKIDRLIGIITILLQQEKATAPELAKRFEVSRRTINRDIEDICKAGIPLATRQGFGGGISVADGYSIDKSLFTYNELQTLLAALQGIDSVSKTSYMATLSDKLSSKGNRIVADNTIIIDLASHYQASLTEKIGTIKKAITENRHLSFEYYYEKGEKQRTIEPYRLVFKWSSWYVFGYCVDKKAFRLFKLNRLWDLEILSDQFLSRDIPKEALSFEDYLHTKNFHLKALFAKSAKHRLIEEYGINCFCVNKNSDLLFEGSFASYENMREWIFSFGNTVRILAPAKLNKDRRQQAQSIVDMPDA